MLASPTRPPRDALVLRACISAGEPLPEEIGRRWYLYPTLAEQGLRFELPYQERLTRSGRELDRRLHEQDIYWWDEQLTEYQFRPAWHDLPRRWDQTRVHQHARAGHPESRYPARYAPHHREIRPVGDAVRKGPAHAESQHGRAHVARAHRFHGFRRRHRAGRLAQDGLIAGHTRILSSLPGKTTSS